MYFHDFKIYSSSKISQTLQDQMFFLKSLITFANLSIDETREAIAGLTTICLQTLQNKRFLIIFSTCFFIT